jgi:DNA-binding response OmpR family regulator
MTASPLPVLVADQDDVSRERLIAVLRGGGFYPLAVRTGGEAVEVVSRRVVPITILDVQLPDLSGIETFRLITSLREGVLGIFLARKRSRDTLLRLLEAGAYTVFQKPPGLKALLAAVRGAASRIGSEA